MTTIPVKLPHIPTGVPEVVRALSRNWMPNLVQSLTWRLKPRRQPKRNFEHTTRWSRASSSTPCSPLVYLSDPSILVQGLSMRTNFTTILFVMGTSQVHFILSYLIFHLSVSHSFIIMWSSILNIFICIIRLLKLHLLIHYTIISHSLTRSWADLDRWPPPPHWMISDHPSQFRCLPPLPACLRSSFIPPARPLIVNGSP